MQPIKVKTYQCPRCNKSYDKYSQAEECCNTDNFSKKANEKLANILKSMPPKIITTEDYIRTVLATEKLIELHYEYFRFISEECCDIINEKQEECKEYLYKVATKLIKKLNEKLTKKVVIDGEMYIPFYIDDLISFHNSDYEDRCYDLIRKIRKRRKGE